MSGSSSAAHAQTPEQLNQQAAKSLATGHIDSALTQLQSACRRFPGDSHLQFNLGLALTRKNRLKDAIAPLQKAAGDPSLAGEAHFLLGANYFADMQYQLALNQLRELSNSSPHSERVLYILEESSRRTGRLEQAKTAFHQLITIHPDSPWTHYLLGNAYEDQQDFDKAIDEYKQAFAKNPTIPNVEFAIGYIYWRQQDPDQARPWLEKEAAAGCHGLANYYLAEISRAEKDFVKAESLYRRSLVCDPSSSDTHMRLGMTLEAQKRYREALAQLQEAVRLKPDLSAGHYHLAAIYRELGRKAEARAELENVRQIQAAKDNGVDVTGASKQ